MFKAYTSSYNNIYCHTFCLETQMFPTVTGCDFCPGNIRQKTGRDDEVLEEVEFYLEI